MTNLPTGNKAFGTVYISSFTATSVANIQTQLTTHINAWSNAYGKRYDDLYLNYCFISGTSFSGTIMINRYS
jgi:hypothetical protein